MNTGKLKSRNHPTSESGAALALVLFFVVFTSLWLMGIMTLTQSSSTAIAKNTSDYNLRNQIVQEAIKRSLEQLTPDPSCPGDPDSESNPCRIGTAIHSCSDKTKFNADFNLPEIGNVKVTCAEQPQSGFSTDNTSILLVGPPSFVRNDQYFISGGDCEAINRCEIGKDGGFKVNTSGAGYIPPEPLSVCDPSPEGLAGKRFTVKGDLVNLFGRFQEISCENFEVIDADNGPASIYSPSNSNKYCPLGDVFVMSAPCLINESSLNWGGKVDGSWIELSSKKIEAMKSLEVQEVVKHMNQIANDDLQPITFSYRLVDNGPLIALPNGYSCQQELTPGVPGPSTIIVTAPEYSPGKKIGKVDSTSLNRLNSLLSNVKCESVIFDSGTYRFLGGTLLLKRQGLFVWGGDLSKLPSPEKRIPGPGESEQDVLCKRTPDSSYSGVRFEMVGESKIEVFSGSLVLCGSVTYSPKTKISSPSPVIIAPRCESYPFSSCSITWSSTSRTSTEPIIQVRNGNASDKTGGATCVLVDTCLVVSGKVVVPASWVKFTLNGSTIVNIEGLLIARALTVDVTASGPPSRFVSAKTSETFSNRRVQLWIDLADKNRKLGTIQLEISDTAATSGSGYSLGTGYEVLAWRTGW